MIKKQNTVVDKDTIVHYLKQPKGIVALAVIGAVVVAGSIYAYTASQGAGSSNGNPFSALVPKKEPTITTLVDLSKHELTNLDGDAVTAEPMGLAIDASGNIVVTGYNINQILTVSSTDGSVSTLAGTGSRGYEEGSLGVAKFSSPRGVAVSESGTTYVTDTYGLRSISSGRDGMRPSVYRLGKKSLDAVVDEGAVSIDTATGVAVGINGDIYVTQSDADGDRVVKVTSSGETSFVAGVPHGADHSADSEALFDDPEGIAIDSSGNLYIADSKNNRIRKVTTDGTVTTFAGSGDEGHVDGTANDAQFTSPRGIAFDSKDNLYVIEGWIDGSGGKNHYVRMITPSGTVSTVTGSAGGGTGSKDATASNLASDWSGLHGIAVDKKTDTIYIADGQVIRKIVR